MLSVIDSVSPSRRLQDTHLYSGLGYRLRRRSGRRDHCSGGTECNQVRKQASPLRRELREGSGVSGDMEGDMGDDL